MKFKQGDLVTVSLTYGSGKVHHVHGRYTGSRRVFVQDEGGHTYMGLPEEADSMGVPELVSEWASVFPAHGDLLPAPAGSRGPWGSQARDADFRLNCGDWLLSLHSLQVRLDSPSVTIEEIGEEGRAWIEGNLSTDLRYERVIEGLTEALGEKRGDEVRRELDEIIWRYKDEARAEAARASYEY